MENNELRDKILVILKSRGIKLHEMALSNAVYEHARHEAWHGLPMLTRIRVGRRRVDEVMHSIRQRLTPA